MKAFTVINVDPGRRPAGALTTEPGLRAIRMRVLRQSTLLARRKSGRMLRRIFGATALRAVPSVLLLLARLGFGVWLVLLGMGILIDGGVSALSLGLMIGGAVVALGFFTRLMMGIGTIAIGYLTVAALASGELPLTGLIVSVSMLLFAISGPGRYSCDSIMCGRIFRAVRRRQMHRLLQNRFRSRVCGYAGMM